MGLIHTLSPALVRRMAAGEVITRPASVVKELVENAIDAGATLVRVAVQNAGKLEIAVEDNGQGMDEEDARLCTARYSTSKLSDIDELTRMSTLGFRGEALASIAAVSRLTIITARPAAQVGVRVDVEAGAVTGVRPEARQPGTTVIVRDLFYNLPVRRSFLKSDASELRRIVDATEPYLLTEAGRSFLLRANGRDVLGGEQPGSLRERFLALLAEDERPDLLPVDAGGPVLRLTGFLVHPSRAARFASLQLAAVNRRPVRSRVILRALYEACGTALAGRNPSFVLLLETAPERIDVNVHPTKAEVGFADERFLFDAVFQAVRQALGPASAPAGYAPAPAVETVAGVQEGLGLDQPVAPLTTGEPDRTRNFWQLHNTYIFAQVQTGCVIIDQHVAHERILYEELLNRAEPVAPQGLLFPMVVELSPAAHAAYADVAAELARLGLVSKPFSGTTVVVDAVPAGARMSRTDIIAVFEELARLEPGPRQERELIARTIACHGAVKAGQHLHATEMESLINRLFACQNPYFCPHGRPTVIRIPLEDLAHRFGR